MAVAHNNRFLDDIRTDVMATARFHQIMHIMPTMGLLFCIPPGWGSALAPGARPRQLNGPFVPRPTGSGELHLQLIRMNKSIRNVFRHSPKSETLAPFRWLEEEDKVGNLPGHGQDGK